MAAKKKILAGREAVDAYREAHHQLHSKHRHKGIPEEHTPLLNIMLRAFKGLGFNAIQEFFEANELLNIQELGFADKEDFEARAIDADREALSWMWE